MKPEKIKWVLGHNYDMMNRVTRYLDLAVVQRGRTHFCSRFILHKNICSALLLKVREHTNPVSASSYRVFMENKYDENFINPSFGD